LESKYSSELKAEMEGKFYSEESTLTKRKRSKTEEVKEDEVNPTVLMTKKDRRRYSRMLYSKKKKQESNEVLVAKRQKLDSAEKEKKKQK